MGLKLTPAIADAIVDAVRRGVPASTAAKAAGISDAALRDWLEAPDTGVWRTGDPVSDESLAFLTSFRERVDNAVAEFETMAIASIAEAGRMTGRSGVTEWRATAWLMNNHPAYNKRYKQERLPVDSAGQLQLSIAHKIVHSLSDSALQRAYEALPEPPGGDR